MKIHYDIENFVVEDFLFSYFISSALRIQNVVIDDLVDERGSHEDIYEFASNADIVICCLSMHKETVRLLLSLLYFYFVCFSKVSYGLSKSLEHGHRQ